ncbi:hypothetical protein ACLB2K_017053 [Fragaria x ananassa]
MLIVSKDTAMIQQLKTDLSEFFDMKDLGPAKRILGMKISRDQGNKKLWLSQKKYIEKVLERFQMEKVKPVSTPLTNHMKLSSKQSPTSQKEEEEMATMPYDSTVGSLMYAIVCTRPGITHGTLKMSLCFGNVKSELVGYIDADMAGVTDTRKSISWQRRKHAASQVYVPKQREGKKILVDSSPSTRIDYGEGPSIAQKSPIYVQKGVECDKTVDVELEEAQLQDEAECSDLEICVSANEQHVVHESVPAKGVGSTTPLSSWYDETEREKVGEDVTLHSYTVKVSEKVDEASNCLGIQPGRLPSSLKGYFQMKIFYWNLRGLANDPTQDLLRKFVRDHHPDVLCIAEPFVSLDSIPSQFWLSMNLVEVRLINK